jgi:spermidine synthase/MFS family permease
MFWIAIFFFLSGLCSLVYELVWLRLAMAKFGVTTALVSIVLSVFMAGLGAGSWIAGWATRRYGDRIKSSALRLYGVIELLIGISALVVPLELTWGSRLLESSALQVSISSISYYFLSGCWLALTLVPWCACMGATIPVAMFAMRRCMGRDSQRSFSFLYLANVIGAVAGASVAPALIEIFGFHGTLHVAALLNVVIFVSATALSLVLTENYAVTTEPVATKDPPVQIDGSKTALLLLFTTGLTTMGMEVIWIRLYTYFVGPLVYSFAKILAVYLAATFAGSTFYRLWSRRRRERESLLMWVSLVFLGLLPLHTADPRFHMIAELRILLGIAPFAGVVGFLSPMLVDRWSGGDPDRAGRAYAVNVLGCIAGPLLAGFFLLPLFGEQVSMLILVLPWLAMAMAAVRQWKFAWQTAATACFLIGAMLVFCFSKDYETLYPKAVIRRDSTATVIASGEGMQRRLLVNGIGMTVLTPITKMMAHFTLAHLATPPRNALIICFGMGTTFRSALSWGIPVTVVELVPSVPALFTYYHSDGAELLASPRAHVVIDDGRRFLDRSSEKFDAIIIDPPPPLNAAGSSLLYSRDFYRLAKQHLAPGGILQQWLIYGDKADWAAATRALTDVFPYVRAYQSMSGDPSFHLLASQSPIAELSAPEMVAQMPPVAITDMMEWGPATTPVEQFDMLLHHEIDPQRLIAPAPETPVLDDDRPINEYDWLRTTHPRLLRKIQ